MYAIKWRSKITGETGFGGHILDLKTARSVCDRMDLKYPEIEHWYESDGE